MRMFALLCAILLGACAGLGDPSDFSPGQVWRLKPTDSRSGRFTVGAVEQRGGRTVVFGSVSDLPGPPSNSVLFKTLRREAGDDLPSGEPVTFTSAGFTDKEGRYSLLTADLSAAPDRPDSSLALPHIAVYASELRREVVRLEQSGSLPHSMFDESMKSWRETDRRWPDLNTDELNWPFIDRITMVIDGASKIASDTVLASRMGPPPPAIADASEIVVDDPLLNARCREIVAPRPLDPQFVDRLLKDGFTREDIPQIDVALSNIAITRSEVWGHVWRADVHDNKSTPQSGWSRFVCWRKTSDEQPAVTSYPQPARSR